MSTAIAVEPEALDSLGAEYGNIELDIRDVARQATVPLQLTPRDPQIGTARLEERLAAMSAVLRSTSGEIVAHKQELAHFANGVRLIDAGRVAFSVMTATPVVIAGAVLRFEIAAWHTFNRLETELEHAVENRVASEFNAVRKAFDGVGRVATEGENDLVHALAGLDRFARSGLNKAEGWLADGALGIGRGAEGLWHGLSQFLSGTERRMRQLEKIVEGLWDTYKHDVAEKFRHLPGIVWGAVAAVAVGVYRGVEGALADVAAASRWVWQHRHEIEEIVARANQPIPTPPKVKGAEVVRKEKVSVEAKVPWEGIFVGGGLSVELDTYDKNGGVDLRIDAKAFVEAGIDSAMLRRLGLDANVTGTLTAGATWHFANREDAMAFALRLSLLAELAALRSSNPLLAQAVTAVMKRTNPNLFEIPKPQEMRAGVSLTGNLSVPGGRSESATASEGLALDKSGGAKLSLGLSATVSNLPFTHQLRDEGIPAPDSITGSLSVTGNTADGKVQVTVSGEFSYAGPSGTHSSSHGTVGKVSTTQRVVLSRTFTLDPSAAAALASHQDQVQQLMHQAFTAGDTKVEVWAKGSAELSAPAGAVKVSGEVDNRLATGTLDQLPQLVGQTASV
jgi:hypothetical protein